MAAAICRELSLLTVLNLLWASQCAILRVGNPIPWLQSRPYLNYVRTSGYEQFKQHYLRSRDVKTPLFLWGDEIEYGIFKYDKERGHYDLHLNGTGIREALEREERRHIDLPIGCEWQPEYGSWMVEAVPRNPYGSYISDLLNVEKSMQLRRKRLHLALPPDAIAPSTSNFPNLGLAGFVHASNTRGNISNSLYVSDEVINPHPRFGALTQNIRMRRGANVNITMYKDGCNGSLDTSSCEEDRIYMDAMAFGMGCCCLQITMQCKSELESRFLHDQLAVLSPVLQAISASTPIVKGHLTNTDTRWDIISQAVDDRTDAERGVGDGLSGGDECLAGQGKRRLNKSRYSSVSLFIGMPRNHEETARLQALNDMPADIDEKAYEELTAGGLDPLLAGHVAHLFVRDPLVIFDDLIEIDNRTQMDHFENIQSTNWRSIRWKLPSLSLGLEFEKRKLDESNERNLEPRIIQSGGSSDRSVMNEEKDEEIDSFDDDSLFDLADSAASADPLIDSAAELKWQRTKTMRLIQDLQSYGPGWRVEFRPLEVQLTDFENAAYSILVVLISRCLVTMNNCHNLYMPMSYVEENMRRAQRKDAIFNQKFWFPRNAFRRLPSSSSGDVSDRMRVPLLEEVEVAEMSIDEIMNGQTPIDSSDGYVYPGLIPMVVKYLKSIGCNASHRVFNELLPYLNMLQKRSAGSLPTAARWMRSYVQAHPAMNPESSAVPSKVIDDLLLLCDEIGMGNASKEGASLYGEARAITSLRKVDDEDLLYADYAGDVCETEIDYAQDDIFKNIDSDAGTSGSGFIDTPKGLSQNGTKALGNSTGENSSERSIAFVSDKIVKMFENLRSENIHLQEE